MKVIVHHLPTGCKWEVNSDWETEKLIEKKIAPQEGFALQDTSGDVFFFSADVIAQSVIKVIE